MLIKDEIELKEILGGVQQQISMATMQPFLELAGMEYLEPVLGGEFLDEIGEYNDDSDTKQLKLLKYLKTSVAHYALAHAAPQLTVAIGDVGMALNVQGGMAAVPKWTYAELVKTGLNTGDSFLEKALVFLEKHESAEIDNRKIFQNWLDSESCTILKRCFVQNATVMTTVFPGLQGSRRFFLKLHGYLDEVEKEWLPNQLGSDLVSELLEHRDDTGVVYPKAINYVRAVVANKAMSKAIPFLNISKDFRLTHDLSINANEYALDRDRRDGLKIASDDAASANFEKLLLYLDVNASETVFANYFNSDLYAERQKNNTKGRFENRKERTYVVL